MFIVCYWLHGPYLVHILQSGHHGRDGWDCRIWSRDQQFPQNKTEHKTQFHTGCNGPNIFKLRDTSTAQHTCIANALIPIEMGPWATSHEAISVTKNSSKNSKYFTFYCCNRMCLLRSSSDEMLTEPLIFTTTSDSLNSHFMFSARYGYSDSVSKPPVQCNGITRYRKTHNQSHLISWSACKLVMVNPLDSPCPPCHNLPILLTTRDAFTDRLTAQQVTIFLLPQCNKRRIQTDQLLDEG